MQTNCFNRRDWYLNTDLTLSFPYPGLLSCCNVLAFLFSVCIRTKHVLNLQLFWQVEYLFFLLQSISVLEPLGEKYIFEKEYSLFLLTLHTSLGFLVRPCSYTVELLVAGFFCCLVGCFLVTKRFYYKKDGDKYWEQGIMPSHSSGKTFERRETAVPVSSLEDLNSHCWQ